MNAKKSKRSIRKKTAAGTTTAPAVPVVAIGASAGGLEAITQLLQKLPADTGMGFVYVQHLEPRHKSNLAEILARITSMSVVEVTDGMRVEPNRIHVIPSNATMGLFHGVLNLSPRDESPESRYVIDYFFRTLADDRGERAIAIVLSGSASDGALGLKAVKAAGGVAFVQEPKSAKYDGMPASAIATVQPDFVLPPEAMAAELGRLARHPYLERTRERDKAFAAEPPDAMPKIFQMLRQATGVDFSFYKQSTIGRRIARRMALLRIDSPDEYARHLQQHAAEVQALFDELLINVTQFFRDAEMFAALKKKVFPRIIEGKDAKAPVRVWVPGCSSGEEAYSLAMALVEFMDERGRHAPIQLFATDISEATIIRARAAVYPENIVADVSAERLKKFFAPHENGYRINKKIREMCVFACQNVIRDPPFCRLDLISCRNLLIYLGGELQKKIIPVFHYALNPSGHLILGTSESVGEFSDLFALVDNRHKIYSRKTAVARLPADFGAGNYADRLQAAEKAAGAIVRPLADLQRAADLMVLANYAPPGVVVNDQMNILQFRGQTDRFLSPSPGVASLSLFNMARRGLLADLRAAAEEVREKGIAARRDGVIMKDGGRTIRVNITVSPLGPRNEKSRSFLILFDEQTAQTAAEKAVRTTGRAGAKNAELRREMEELRRELQESKRDLQITVEAQEVANEELRAANEEIQSSNEELQSTNEELETAKEELQSGNEELTTLNEELENRNAEMRQLIEQQDNLLNNVDIAMIMLTGDLRIRRFTPLAGKELNLIPTDVGRPLSDINLGLDAPDLISLIGQVIATLRTDERDVLGKNGRWYRMRIRPYRTANDRIEGAVLSFVDISALRRNAEKAARSYAEAVAETARGPILILDADMKVIRANHTYYKFFRVTPAATEGRDIFALGTGQWDVPKLRKLLVEIIPQKSAIEDYEVTHDFPGIGRRSLLLNARCLRESDHGAQLILLAFEDVTKRETEKSTGGEAN